MNMICRPAKKEDRAQILEITSNTWEGWDYVPLVLDRWYREGGIFVAEKNQEVVGVTKTTPLSPGEWWLEGIRVKEGLRGQGIGRQLAFYQLGEALKKHPRVIRLSTAEVNKESIRLIEKMGFSLVHIFTYVELHNPKARTPFDHISGVNDPEELQKTITQSEFLNESRGLIPWSWIFMEPSPHFLRASSAAEQYFVYEDKGVISGILLLRPHRYEDSQIELSLIDASTAQILNILFELAIHIAALGKKGKIGFFSPSGRLEKQAQDAGFFFPYDFRKVLVYELVP
jgi:GNAT superfamily N-acetyltransferase